MRKKYIIKEKLNYIKKIDINDIKEQNKYLCELYIYYYIDLSWGNNW